MRKPRTSPDGDYSALRAFIAASRCMIRRSLRSHTTTPAGKDRGGEEE